MNIGANPVALRRIRKSNNRSIIGACWCKVTLFSVIKGVPTEMLLPLLVLFRVLKTVSYLSFIIGSPISLFLDIASSQSLTTAVSLFDVHSIYIH